MKSKFEICLLAITTSLLVLCLGAPAQADLAQDTDKTSNASAGGTSGSDAAASVNGVAISRDQFDNAMAYQQEIAAIRGLSITDAQLPLVKYQVLENLINQELLYQESQRYGISIDENEINETYEERKQKANFNTDAEFEEALKATHKSVASYREEIKEGLAIDQFVQKKFTDQTVVSDSDAKQYYDSNPDYFQQPEQVKVSHIMARFTSGSDESEKDAAREKIEKVSERLKAGEDFASVAGEVSEDPSSKESGGDLGYFSKGQTPQSFEDAAFALKKDEISDIVETGSGYHILKLTDRKNARTVSFEEAKDDIVSSLKTSRVNSSVDNYIKELKTKSTIVTYPVSQ